MAVKVAINGFGRIGRLAFRQMFGAEGYEIVAINDLTSPKMLAHLLKYDTAQGRYEGHTVESDETSITVDGKKIEILAEKDPANLPWGKIGVDVVLECTGFFASKAKSQAHIDAGAKKVVISAPAGNDLPTIVYSVNENTLTAEDLASKGAGCNTLIITTGTSGKGMGAAGTDINYEIERCSAVAEAAKEAGMTICIAHVEGMSRRTDANDQASIDSMLPYADVIMVVDESDSDGLFTDYATENNIPIKPNNAPPTVTAKIIHKGLISSEFPIILGPNKFPSIC